jgi:hypothetical protein
MRTIATTRRSLVCAALVGAALLLPACGKGKPKMPVREVKLHYISMFKQGAAFGDSGTIKARDYDRSNLDMIDVSIDDGEMMMHADRAQLIVDVEKDTIAIRLIGVTMSDAGPQGGVFENPIFEPTTAMALEFDAVP